MSESVEKLKTEYREMAVAHGKATFSGDYKAANLSHDKIVALVPKIRVFGKEGEAALLALTQDHDEAVACWAATHALSFNEKQSLYVLENLAKKPGPMGFNAKMVVQQWKKGQLILP
jgi:hypothetical protein